MATAEHAIGLLERLLQVVHQPNPRDLSRWDVKPGGHKAFCTLIEDTKTTLIAADAASPASNWLQSSDGKETIRERRPSDDASPASVTEEVAKWMISKSYATGHGDTVANLLNELECHLQERALTEEDISTLQAAVENLRGGSRDPERRAEAAFRIAYELEQITKRPASPASGVTDQEQVLVSWVRSHITSESIKGSDILKLLSIINRLSASPSVTEEEIKKLMVTIPKKEFATASDDYMRGYQSGVNAHMDAVLALIRGERGT